MLAERVTEWTQKWKLEWLAEGEASGIMKGQATLLSRQIAAKFGDQVFKKSVQEHLQNATPEQLNLWADRILFAKTVEELFSSN